MKRNVIESVLGAVVLIVAGLFLVFAYIGSDVKPVQGYELQAKFNAIYGSFAALPLFLIWLQLSWMLVLLGVEVSYALQHAERHEFEPDIRRASPRVRRIVALGIVQIVVERFRRQEDPVTATELVDLLEAPTRLVNSVIEELIDAKILVEVAPRGRRGPGFNPAQSPDNFTIQGVIDLLDRRGSERMPIKLTDAMERISERLELIRDEAESSEANRSALSSGFVFGPTGSWPRALGSAVNRSSSGSTALRIASRTSDAEFDKLSAVRVWRGRAERRVTSSPTMARTLLTRCL